MALNTKFLTLALSIAVLGLLSSIAYAQGTAEAKAYGAAIAMGLSAIGAGYAIGKAGAAASAATAEKPEVSGRLLIYLVLGEGIAIYGLLIAILVLFALK